MNSNSVVSDSSAPALTVYFDGACPVCSKEIAVYRGQPGAQRCQWIDAATCPDEAFGPGLTREQALARFHVRSPDGRLIDGMRGFAALWRTLPRTAWLGRVAGFGPMPWLLDAAYRAFLVLRRAWRPSASPLPWPAATVADLRSDHAGEVGAVQIYRGILAVSRDAALRRFADHHLATEQGHLQCIEAHLPAAHRSRLLPAWRLAGWLTGALPALFGPRAVYATIAAVEAFVDRHYAEQIERIDRLTAGAAEGEPPLQAAPAGAAGAAASAADAGRLLALRADLERCRQDEVAHREDALQSGPATGAAVRLWTALVDTGSAQAVALARRV